MDTASSLTQMAMVSFGRESLSFSIVSASHIRNDTSSDTYKGFRALGFSFFISLFAAVVICSMSYPSLPASHWFPDPFFRIYVNGLHKAKHGSDSGSFNRDGTFDQANFDQFWK